MQTEVIEDKFGVAVEFYNQGKLRESEILFREVLKENAEHADSIYYLALLASRSRKYDLAIKLFNKAIAIKYDDDYYINLGNAFFALTNYESAAECYLKVIEHNPNSTSAYNNLGVSYEKRGDHKKALECYYKSLEIDPNYCDAYSNIGISLNRQGKSDEAIECYYKAIEIRPKHVDAYYNLGVAYKDKRDVGNAIINYEKALELNPRYMDVYLNLGIAYLLDRNFEQGWKYYEYRFTGLQPPVPIVPREKAKPKWDGSSLEGKTIYVYHEQGIGDTLQFVRFLNNLNHLGAKQVLFKCQEGLEYLLMTSNLGAEIISKNLPDHLVDFDVYIPLLSLPYHLKVNNENISGSKYLKSDINRVFVNKYKYFNNDKFKIGIFWQGSVDHKGDKDRSLSLKHFYPLFEFPNVQVYSLQKGFGSEQLKELPENYNIIDLGESFNDFSDTAAAIENLDLVITIDSSVAHLAGALGKPVWIILPKELEWRWFQDEESTIWYETARLFRPKYGADRTETIERVLNTLKEKLG